VKFQDRYLPQNVERVLASPGEKTGRTQFTAKLEKMELMATQDDAQFTPPADATAPPQVITLDEKTTRAQLLQHAPPVYPPIAMAARVSGDVVISMQVQTDGHVGRLRVLSGPAMLQWAALEGVKKWIYKPFEQNGEAVEVNTNVTVPFRLMP
jgi:TonB family protein